MHCNKSDRLQTSLSYIVLIIICFSALMRIHGVNIIIIIIIIIIINGNINPHNQY